jgi:hypothetical protein
MLRCLYEIKRTPSCIVLGEDVALLPLLSLLSLPLREDIVHACVIVYMRIINQITL